MKFLHALLAGVLAMGSLSLPLTVAAGSNPGSPPAVVAAPAEASTVPAARPGTPDELRDYELREASSPQVQEYAGGEVIVVIGVFGVIIFLFCGLVIIVAD